MIRYFMVALLGVSLAYAISPGSLNEESLKAILVKMKNNDPLSQTEKTEFNNAVQHVESKIANADGKKTSLTTVESQINNQQKINQITPTINDLLEKGKQYPWGLDLDLVEKRGFAIRSGQLGGEDVTSYISTFQKFKPNPKNPGYAPALRKIMSVTKLPEKILKKLPDWDTWGQMKSGTWFSQCPCLIQLIETNLQAPSTKKGVSMKLNLTLSKVKIKIMKTEADQALANVNKEMRAMSTSMQEGKNIENYPRFEKSVQAVRQMEANCLKSFTKLSNDIQKASKGKIVLDSSQCARQVKRSAAP